MVRWRSSILSLGSGDGIPALVGQNEVCEKMAESTQYNTNTIWVQSTFYCVYETAV